ncbi:hypothetical protein KW429_11910 [Vibrio fluvialis]|nr:hypothetical protein [Vibrio fluvialis]
MENEINGFVFNAIGDLINEPQEPSLELLKETLETLYKQQQYISASRIQHRINVIIMQGGKL